MYTSRVVTAAKTPSIDPIAPGAYRAPGDQWGAFSRVIRNVEGPGLALVDRRVAALHPQLERTLRRVKGLEVALLPAGERTKTLGVAERLLQRMTPLPRNAVMVAVGGGTVGDLATVVAHLHKRGARLVQVPTTLLAAVDSSLGGKGAVNLAKVKNGAGVFHYAEATLLCPELFETLSPAQLREGLVEAWKMAVCLDAKTFQGWTRKRPPLETLVRQARSLKASVCARDPYERQGLRRVLNFGHTFGHVFEGLSGFRVRHGEAVGLGVLCALDVGRAVGVTPDAVAEEVEAAFVAHAGVKGRAALAKVLSSGSDADVEALLRADKKSERAGELKMVLLSTPGAWEVRKVERRLWIRLLRSWRRGDLP